MSVSSILLASQRSIEVFFMRVYLKQHLSFPHCYSLTYSGAIKGIFAQIHLFDIARIHPISGKQAGLGNGTSEGPALWPDAIGGITFGYQLTFSVISLALLFTLPRGYPLFLKQVKVDSCQRFGRGGRVGRE